MMGKRLPVASPAPALGIAYTCQKCTERVVTTRSRKIYTKDYMGPCGDSFCFAGCDSPACRPIDVTVCDDCAKELGRSEGTRR